MEVAIITGMSGAGKTKAAAWFEDRGYYCIDNMPPALIKNFLDLAISGGRPINKVAFIIDIRGGDFFNDLKEMVLTLREDETIDVKVLFIEASDQVLIRRYSETRRVHPLNAGLTTRDAIEMERKALAPLRANANYIIDTSGLKVAEFNAELSKLFEKKDTKETFVINIKSFGYKHGIPTDSDWVLDVRFIPNPYYVASLNPLTGNNKKVSQYVLKHDITKAFVNRTYEIIKRLIPCYTKEGKYSLTVSFGCTGGHHRSVAVANEIYKRFLDDGYRVTLEHRNL